MDPLYWLIAALLLGAVEAAVPAGVFLFFGLGALASCLLALLVDQLVWQMACFAVMSLLSLALLRGWWRGLFSGRAIPAGEEVEHPLIGQQGCVREAISPLQPGVVEVGGSFWRAVAEGPEESLPAGTPVIVQGALPQDGLMLRVAARVADGSSRSAG
ncbi:NfeD family protein [uncultured Desulfovibrio sp.]|uniref:NfeD family protein n=1 Tax=uncultured Desulfovibrio sp. TaxID=167968 RepID=UPI0026045E64|nr:NfeD family protein [uncultured Desulfovibrio sp.]